MFWKYDVMLNNHNHKVFFGMKLSKLLFTNLTRTVAVPLGVALISLTVSLTDCW